MYEYDQRTAALHDHKMPAKIHFLRATNMESRQLGRTWRCGEVSSEGTLFEGRCGVTPIAKYSR